MGDESPKKAAGSRFDSTAASCLVLGKSLSLPSPLRLVTDEAKHPEVPSSAESV